MLASFPTIPHFFRASLNPEYGMIWAVVALAGPPGCAWGIGWPGVALAPVPPGGLLERFLLAIHHPPHPLQVYCSPPIAAQMGVIVWRSCEGQTGYFPSGVRPLTVPDLISWNTLQTSPHRLNISVTSTQIEHAGEMVHFFVVAESQSCGLAVVSRLDMYRTKVLMYRTMVLLARLIKVRC